MEGQRSWKKYDPRKLDFSRQMRKQPTQAEAILWKALRGKQLAGWKFRRQHLLFGFIADFYCVGARLCVELDGAVHDSETARENDRFRDFVMSENGIQVLRLKNSEVTKNLERALIKIEEALGGRTS